MSESSILAERVYIRQKPSRILAKRVYIRQRYVSLRSNIAKCVSESRILPERVYVTPNSNRILAKHMCIRQKSVSARSSITNRVSESKTYVAEGVYITPIPAPERNNIAKCVSENKILAERVNSS